MLSLRAAYKLMSFQALIPKQANWSKIVTNKTLIFEGVESVGVLF
jgi:hypothetical protein